MTKVFIKTYGCSFNHADSENMAGLLNKEERYEIVDNEEEADVVIINSCTVKQKAESKFWYDVRNINKKKILAGCVPQATKDKSKFQGYPVIGTKQITKVVDVVDKTLEGDTVQLLDRTDHDRLNIPKVRKNAYVEIMPINEGCLGSCNFCKTKFARGNLTSYPPESIIAQIRTALNDGVREIWLTSQDTACYGYDIDTSIVSLLKDILTINRDFRIRLGMGNPDFLPDYFDELLDIFEDKRLFRFLHIPVQAGSDRVLTLMNREYTIATFKNIVKRARERYPDMTLATDIICGYPGETEEDFQETLNLIESVEFDVVNMSKFWPRPGTLAARKKQLPTKVVKMRSKRLAKTFYATAKKRNTYWQDWSGPIVIDERGKYDGYKGRNYAYKPVIVKGDYSLGETVDVTIHDTATHDLRGTQT